MALDHFLDNLDDAQALDKLEKTHGAVVRLCTHLSSAAKKAAKAESQELCPTFKAELEKKLINYDTSFESQIIYPALQKICPEDYSQSWNDFVKKRPS